MVLCNTNAETLHNAFAFLPPASHAPRQSEVLQVLQLAYLQPRQSVPAKQAIDTGHVMIASIVQHIVPEAVRFAVYVVM